MVEKLNPRTLHLEFAGTLGAAAISFGLPFWINALYAMCNGQSCAVSNGVKPVLQAINSTTWISWSAVKVYTAWLFGLAVLDRVVPGKSVPGHPLRNGEVLQYKFNGSQIVAILLSTLVLRAWQTSLALPELVYVYEHLIELANASILWSVGISTWLYARSFTKDVGGKDRVLALGGNSGKPLYDWFIGRDLNPRLGEFDIKTFLEMRPGLLLWIVINLASAHHQYVRYGYVSDSMILVCLFQGWYVVEGTIYEEGLVSMIDIVYDGLGFMLVFGDLSLVPFTYTLQTRYLADHPVNLGHWAVAAITSVYLGGLYIFRSSNNEKARFKNGDKSTQHLKYITSPTGSKLLVSGWWGVARHINYTGDWIASWAYSLPCGNALIPYYFVLFFATLLIHREQRDEAKCATKYGNTWKEYKKQVPYRFFPGFY